MSELKLALSTDFVQSSFRGLEMKRHVLPNGMRIWRFWHLHGNELIVTATAPVKSCGNYVDCELSIFDKKIKVAYIEDLILIFSDIGYNTNGLGLMVDMLTQGCKEALGILRLRNGVVKFDGAEIPTEWSSKLFIRAEMCCAT